MSGNVGFGLRVKISAEDCDDFGGSVMEILAGKSTDMVFHTKVKKIFYVLAGKIKVTVVSNGQMASVEFDAGKTFAAVPGTVYQIVGAADRSFVIEFCNASINVCDNDTFTISNGTKAQSGDNDVAKQQVGSQDEPVKLKKEDKKNKKKSKK